MDAVYRGFYTHVRLRKKLEEDEGRRVEEMTAEFTGERLEVHPQETPSQLNLGLIKTKREEPRWGGGVTSPSQTLD